MKSKLKTVIVCSLILCLFCGILTGCNSDNGRAVSVSDLGIIHEEEFGGVYIDITIDEFNALGFEYGDSVTVSFSNGYKLKDIPYYNGYYTQTGEPLLIAYPFVQKYFVKGVMIGALKE